MEKAGPFDFVAAISQCCRRLSACVRALTVHILSTFCGVFMVQCVKLMLRIFEFGILYDCFVWHHSIDRIGVHIRLSVQKCLYILPLLRYSESNIGVTL